MKIAASTTRPPDSNLDTRPSGTVLAFDFGARRLGVAVGELTLRIAHPLETIQAATEEARMEQVGRLIKEWSPVLLVVGLPSHMDGTEHELSARCRRLPVTKPKRGGRATAAWSS